ncbi:MAG: hypothetical protein K2N82_08835 [Lachnospiraceae bacterium]|nr:hypothetical protein [Lachnospiraceae bacterium]
MKKIFYVFTALICYMLLSIPVKADVIWEPFDPFYEAHADECEYMGRSFTANGPDGKVILYKSPELPEVVAVWENGHKAYIHFTYRDQSGILWGIYDDYQDTVGWVPMDYMEVIYDSISFREEHSAQITEQSGELSEDYQGQDIFLWRYPGSTEYDSLKYDNYPPTYDSVYVDENENRWGLVGYWYGFKNVWICLNAPNADLDQLYPYGVPVVETPKTPNTSVDAPRIVPKSKSWIIPLTVFLVLLTVAVTTILLLLLKRKKD